MIPGSGPCSIRHGLPAVGKLPDASTDQRADLPLDGEPVADRASGVLGGREHGVVVGCLTMSRGVVAYNDELENGPVEVAGGGPGSGGSDAITSASCGPVPFPPL